VYSCDFACFIAVDQVLRNPFATASRIHLALVSCHPFGVSGALYPHDWTLLNIHQDGNGRLVRLISSIPLLRHGYPPISISSSQRADYYDAINKVCRFSPVTPVKE